MNRTIRILRHALVAGLSAFAMLCLFDALSIATEQATIRPSTVPQEYVITPFGYFHPSCVQGLAENETLLYDGRVLREDGSVRTVASCTFPHFTPSGETVAEGISTQQMTAQKTTATAETSPVVSGWLEYVSTTTSTSYGEIAATWTVPPAPANYEEQTLFFFPGFEDINNVLTIVQPVLQFGASSAGGGEYWSIASWNCCVTGQAWFSGLKKVSVGDTISGKILPACSRKKFKTCTTWKIVTKDQTTGKKSTLNQINPDGQTWNWAFGAVLEVYGVRQCSDFADNSSTTLTVQLYDSNFEPIADPGWTANPAGAGVTPQCNYGLDVTDTVETLEY
jgi:hypothetical protein